jgi:UDP-N-acetylmuramoylalanine--D-glutamate ligase
VAAKARVFANQGPGDWAVVNADDPVVLEQARAARARKLLFRVTGEPLPSGDGAFFDGGLARFRLDGHLENLFRRDEVVLPGAHLAGDLLVAAAAARLLGAPAEAIARAVRAFHGVEHVLEHVATIGGVLYYNDSKATNVEAARRSLEAFTQPVLIVLGGRYKGGDLGELAPELRTHGRHVLAIGEARDRVKAALEGVVPVDPCSSMRDAVERAHAAALSGDVVLLAPACSSFDMFADYADRGRAFKAEVRRLAEAVRG